MDRVEGGESTIETEKQDRADQMELGFGESLFQLIDTVWDDGGNKIENCLKWLLVKISHFWGQGMDQKRERCIKSIHQH